MARQNFKRSLKYVLKHEGGYVDHPRDPGGATNLGITRRTLAAHRGVSPWRNLPKSEVRKLTLREAADIYRKKYWNYVRADTLPSGLDYCVFDAAVNSGPSRARRWLISARKRVPSGDVPKTIDTFCNTRLAFVKGLRTWGTFGRGWGRRIKGVRRYAKIMARGKPLLQSKQVAAGSALGGLSFMSLFDNLYYGNEILSMINMIVPEGWDTTTTLMVGGGATIVGLTGWIIYERYRRGREFGF